MRELLVVLAFLCIWFAFPVLGFVVPMQTLDHGDVGSAAAAVILTIAGAIIGPFVAYPVARLLWKTYAHRT